MKKNIYILIILYQGMIYTKDSHDHISSNVDNDIDIDEDIHNKENKIIVKNNSPLFIFLILLIYLIYICVLIFNTNKNKNTNIHLHVSAEDIKIIQEFYSRKAEVNFERTEKIIKESNELIEKINKPDNDIINASTNKNIKKYNNSVEENIIIEFDKLMQEVSCIYKLQVNWQKEVTLYHLQKRLLDIASLECNFIEKFINNIEKIPLNVLETLIPKMTEYFKKKQIYNNIIIKDCVEDPYFAQEYHKQHFYFTTEAKTGITTKGHLANYFVTPAVLEKLAKIYNELFNDIKKSNSPLNFNFNTLNSWINKYSQEDDQQYRNFNLLISCYFLSDIPWGIFLYKYLSKITELEHEKITEELKRQEIIKELNVKKRQLKERNEEIIKKLKSEERIKKLTSKEIIEQLKSEERIEKLNSYKKIRELRLQVRLFRRGELEFEISRNWLEAIENEIDQLKSDGKIEKLNLEKKIKRINSKNIKKIIEELQAQIIIIEDLQKKIETLLSNMVKIPEEISEPLSDVNDMINIMAQKNKFDVWNVGANTFVASPIFFYHMTLNYLNVKLFLSNNEEK